VLKDRFADLKVQSDALKVKIAEELFSPQATGVYVMPIAAAFVLVPLSTPTSQLLVGRHGVVVQGDETEGVTIPEQPYSKRNTPVGAVPAAAGLERESMITGAVQAAAPATPAALIIWRRERPLWPLSVFSGSLCVGATENPAS
jgi:hypothetical protein